MKREQHECIHCGIRYQYYLSGGNGGELNDASYCPDCKQVMLDALKTVEVKFKWKLVCTDEITREELIKLNSNSIIHRPTPGLYNQKTGDMSIGFNIKDPVTDIDFHLSEWKKSPEYTIHKKAYWDIKLDKSVDNVYYINDTICMNPDKDYPKESNTGEYEIKPIPLSDPIGLDFLLKYQYYESKRNDGKKNK
jgi:hypothetical protein